MSEALSTDALNKFLTSGDWKVTFSSTVIAAGFKTARAKQVTRCDAERLDTGDVEITASIIDPSGHQDETTIALWPEEGELQLDTSCTCAVRTCCTHAAAALEHLSRPGRLDKAFGELPEEVSLDLGFDAFGDHLQA